MQGDEDKFPEVIKEFHDKEFKITLKITEENVKKESDVYEACDISVLGEDNVSSKQSFGIPSPSAEDDNTAIVSLLYCLNIVKVMNLFIFYFTCIFEICSNWI